MNRPGAKSVINDAACFVCGPDNPIGIKAEFTVDKAAGASFAELNLADHFQGWQGIVHGGILATLLDEACAYACMTATDQCLTAEISVRYRKPVPVGETLQLSGRLVEQNRKLWRARSEIRIAGTLHAEAEAKMFILG